MVVILLLAGTARPVLGRAFALILVRHDERPALDWHAGFDRIVFDVSDSAPRCCFRIQEHLPAAGRPRTGHSPVWHSMVRQWMDTGGVEASRTSPFEYAGQCLGVESMAADDKVRVIGHDGARMDDDFQFVGNVSEFFRDRIDLDRIKLHDGILEILFGFQSRRVGVRMTSDGTMCLDLGCRAGLAQLWTPHFVGPGATGVVWQPKTVGGEDEVVAEDHGWGLVGRWEFSAFARPGGLG